VVKTKPDNLKRMDLLGQQVW